MGGHGGKRIGAGRKPKTRKERWLSGNAGKINLSAVPSRLAYPKSPDSAAVPLPETPSAILTPEEAAYWELWAPLARARGTLIPETVPGFVQLCQVARRCARLWTDIDSVGLMFEVTFVDSSGQERHELKRHPLLSEWRGLVQRQEVMLSRYGLSADGKVPADAGAGDAEDLKLARLLATG